MDPQCFTNEEVQVDEVLTVCTHPHYQVAIVRKGEDLATVGANDLIPNTPQGKADYVRKIMEDANSNNENY